MGPLYGSPEESIKALADISLKARFGDNSGMQYTSAPAPLGPYFTRRDIEVRGDRGIVFYHIFPMDPMHYVEAVFFTTTQKELWPRYGPFMVNGAASIRCVTQTMPSSGGGGHSKSPEDESVSTYNKEMGTEWVHSKNGENFLVDYNTQYSENGPDGPGYYHVTGSNNDWEKLQSGYQY